MPSPPQISKQLPHGEFVFVIALVMAATALAIDIILPSMLDIGRIYSVKNENAVQFLITAYAVPYGVFQLFGGPFADRFGRRPLILAGLLIYGLAATLSLFAPSFEALVALRALAGAGAAFSRVGVITMVRDRFSGRKMASVMSLVMMVFMVVPIAAPLGGQAIIQFADWTGIFTCLAIFAAIISTWVFLRLPETLDQENRRPLSAAQVINSFKIVAQNKTSMAFSWAQASFFGGLFGFINLGPQIYQRQYDLGIWFPVAFSLGGLIMAGASLINSRMVLHHGMRRMATYGLLTYVSTAMACLVISVIYKGHPPTLFLLFSIPVIVHTFAFAGTNLNALAMEPMGKQAGMAASIFGFMQTVLAGLIGGLIGSFYDGTVYALYGGFAICAGVSSLLFFWAARRMPPIAT